VPVTELEAFIAEQTNQTISVAVYDLETGDEILVNPDEAYHPASTIKVHVMMEVFRQAEQGLFRLGDRLPIINAFTSIADGSKFSLDVNDDAEKTLYPRIGETETIAELTRLMIVRSSNLATNLLLDLLGLEFLQHTLDEHELGGIDLRRGVEDELAFEHGINNRVTADGLVDLLQLIAEERAFTPELSRSMLEILHDQEFRSGIPAGLPPTARVAHKTGEISTIAHDAGIVYMPNRKPYVVAILTEWDKDVTGRKTTIAAASYQVYEYLTGNE